MLTISSVHEYENKAVPGRFTSKARATAATGPHAQVSRHTRYYKNNDGDVVAADTRTSQKHYLLFVNEQAGRYDEINE